jgi:hypothetical protein
MVTVFVSPSPIAFDQGKRVASPIASLQFGRHRKEDDDWYVGSNGPYEGWIALAKGPKHVGAPLSTKALKKIGDDILGSPSAQGSVSNRNKPAEDKRN